MKSHIYDKGTILLFSEGSYSDFGYCGETVTLVDLDLPAEIAAWREMHPDEIDWKYGPSAFVAHLVATQKVAPLECQTVHIGEFGDVRL